MTNTGLTKCARCGKLFATTPDKKYCFMCGMSNLTNLERVERAMQRMDSEAYSIEDLAEATGLTVEEVQNLARTSTRLRKDIEAGKPCMRCRKRPAQLGADFCVECRFTLHHALGEASRDLVTKCRSLREKLMDMAEPTGVVAAMDEKRVRYPHDRFDPTPKSRY